MKKQLLSLCLIASAITTHAQIVTTIAGGGSSPGDGIPGTSSILQSPYQVALDKYGNAYIADYIDHKVRKLDTAGIITTIAGTGSSGSTGDGGPATAATFNALAGIAVDGSGNIYVADNGDHTVRKIDAAGMISRYAGTGLGGSTGDGAPATGAKIYGPNALLVDGAGNLYISCGQSRIRKVDAAGTITTFAGTGTAGYTGDGTAANTAQINTPREMAMDAAGNLYFTDFTENAVRKVNTSGIISKVIHAPSFGDGGDGGPATSSLAQLNSPGGLCIDRAGNLYISNEYGGRIRKIDMATGMLSTYAGTAEGSGGDGGPATAAEFSQGGAYLAMDCADNMFLSEKLNQKLRKITVVHNPYYVGTSLSFGICKNAAAMPIGSMLQGENPGGVGETLEWSVAVAPAHGTITGAPYSTTVVAGTMTPTLSYTPAAGYTGTDVFTIQLGCGQVGKTRTISVAVNDCATGVSPEPSNPSAPKGGLHVYPNPVNDVVHVDGLQGNATYRLLNVVGSALLSGSLDNVNNVVNVGNVASGVYMLEVTAADGQKAINRIVKQ